MKNTILTKIVAFVLCMIMVLSLVPVGALAVTYDESKTGDYYNVISKNDYVLCDGAVESEIVINNDNGTRRQVLHVIEVDPNNPNVSVLPAYYAIDKDLTDPANWSAQIMEKQMDYYRDELGYNVVGGMNTALAYDNEAPSSFMVWNGQVLATPALHGNSQTYLAVTKKDDGTVKFELRATSEALHGDEWQAVSCNFGFVIKNGKLVTTKENRSDAADRSMIGIKADGTLVICQAEGRNAPYAVGLSSYEIGETMLALGCVWAVNGDGGGSSQFLTKREGESDYSLRNIPSDGSPRATINGIIVVSNSQATGQFDHVSMTTANNMITPGTSVPVEIKGVDPSGAPAPLPAEGLTYTAVNGSFADGVFTSDGTVGTASVTAYYEGVEVGTIEFKVVIPTAIEFNSPVMVVPYSKTVEVGMTAYYESYEIVMKADDVVFSMTNPAIGTFNGFNFTAVSTEMADAASVLTATLVLDDSVKATADISLGKGSEIVYDFEDGDIHGFFRSTAANYNYICVGGDTFLANAENGHVRHGQYALGVEIDFSDSLEAGFSLGNLHFGETKIFANAKTVGMWIYVPDEAVGLRIDPTIYSVDADGKHKATTGGNASIPVGSTEKTETGFVSAMEESGWYYITIDVSTFENTGFLAGNSFLKFYISQKDGQNGYVYGEHNNVNGKYTFYVDDITIDYSSAVDDREAPIFSDVVYLTPGMDEGTSLKGQTITSNTVSFTASVAENTSKTNYTGIDTASGKVYVDNVDYTDKLVWTGNSKMALNDVELADGRHLVKFTVCDKMGNFASIIREITINSVENAPVKVVAHDPDADRILLGSLYYIDVVAAAIENVDSITVTLDLNNVSTWHLDHMDVTKGFTASYTLKADEAIATVTIKKTGDGELTGEAALISIPIRTWQLEPVVAITGHPGKIWMYPDYKKGNEILPMDINVEIDGGMVTFTDGTTASFASPTIQVDTELSGNAYTSSGSAGMNYIRNEPWYKDWNGGHDHRVETHQYYAPGATNVVVPVAVPDKAPTCTEAGYTGRTYCETCKSIADFGTTIPATGHTYKVVDNKLVCDCGETLYANGIVEAGDNLYFMIAGTLVSGWQAEEGKQYYFSPEGYAAVDGEQVIDGYDYLFEDCILVRGDWVETEKGFAYRWAGQWLVNCWLEYEGDLYFLNFKGYRLEGLSRATPPQGGVAQNLLFTEDGVWLGDVVGLYTDKSGNTYYLDHGIALKAGVVQDAEGNYYYIGSSFTAVKNTTRTIRADMTNGLLSPHFAYTFDENGVITNPVPVEPETDAPETEEPEEPGEVKNGLTWDDDGEIRYYENGKAIAAGVVQDAEGNYYYISSSLVATKNTSRTIRANMTNGLLSPHFTYIFDENGVITNPVPVEPETDEPETEEPGEVKNGLTWDDDGEIRYYENGKAIAAGVVQDAEGNYYYISSSLVATKNTTRTIRANMTNGLLSPHFTYIFDENGVITNPVPVEPETDEPETEEPGEVKNGLTWDEDGEIRYYENGVAIAAGVVQDAEGNYYYISSSLVATKNTTRTIRANMTNGLLSPHFTYIFDENGVITNPVPVEPETDEPETEEPEEPGEVKNGLTWDDDGEIRYYENGKAIAAGVVQDAEGNYYYISSSLVATKNTSRTIRAELSNGLLSPHFTYIFDENGVITNPVPVVVEPEEPDVTKNGLIEEDGELFYYVNGELVHAGLIFVNDAFYYINSSGKAVCGETRYIGGGFTNDLLPAGEYTFGEDGKMILD